MNVKIEFQGPYERQIGISLEIASAVRAFDRLDDRTAWQRCEERRQWLLAQVAQPWLAQELTRAGLSPTQARDELDIAFHPFTRPAGIIVRFTDGPIAGLAPGCPMATYRGSPQTDVWTGAFGPDLRALEMSATQLMFHELIHLCGDEARHHRGVFSDNIPRMNWAGVGALVRTTAEPPEPVSVVDHHRKIVG
jgi:hypothetical protein